MVTPVPGWVLKVLRTNGDKILVNICSHSDIPTFPVPRGFDKWPPMIVNAARSICEGTSQELTVYDATVNTEVIKMSNDDPAIKEATCLRAIRMLQKTFGEGLDRP